ncbi:hypothetical protein T01_14137 [Trichinella spiralis]|uniref:Uncharacterized protein n=1 Tax=Trichinella spiralis TaxID=6334 RepID=A0A0V1BBN1_TRISP|nr:hypothetical protein T01_14137 [Trichinella spiralis]
MPYLTPYYRCSLLVVENSSIFLRLVFSFKQTHLINEKPMQSKLTIYACQKKLHISMMWREIGCTADIQLHHTIANVL